MRRRLQVRALCTLFAALLSAPVALADDFPGKGDRFAWSNALPYYNLANKYLEHGRFEEAKTNFEEAIYRYEYDPDFYINYGVALRKLESYSAAEEAFKKAIELRPNDWQAWSDLANANLKQNRLKETISCFQKAMKVQPPPPPAEKAAMLKDIADINKILSMQAPPPAAKASASSAEPAKTKSKGASKLAAKATDSKNSGANNGGTVHEKIEPVDKQQLNKSGWDWVQ